MYVCMYVYVCMHACMYASYTSAQSRRDGNKIAAVRSSVVKYLTTFRANLVIARQRMSWSDTMYAVRVGVVSFVTIVCATLEDGTRPFHGQTCNTHTRTHTHTTEPDHFMVKHD